MVNGLAPSGPAARSGKIMLGDLLCTVDGMDVKGIAAGLRRPRSSHAGAADAPAGFRGRACPVRRVSRPAPATPLTRPAFTSLRKLLCGSGHVGAHPGAARQQGVVGLSDRYRAIPLLSGVHLNQGFAVPALAPGRLLT